MTQDTISSRKTSCNSKDSFHFNDSLDHYKFTPGLSESVITSPNGSIVTISPIQTPKASPKNTTKKEVVGVSLAAVGNLFQTKMKVEKVKKARTTEKRKRKTAVSSLIIVPIILVISSVIATILVKKEEAKNTTPTTITTTTVSTTNITMTPYDFTSTANPFTCDKDWLGDGICDDETNISECDYDSGDCCLNEITTTNCHECICHENGKIQQPTTTTEFSGAICPLFFVMTSEATPFPATYFSEIPSCQEQFTFSQEINLDIPWQKKMMPGYFYQSSSDYFVVLTGSADMHQIKFMDNEITWQEFPKAQDHQPFNARLTAAASSKNGRFFLMEASDAHDYCETFIYTDEKWEKGPTYPFPLIDSCALFLLNNEDVVYIFGGFVFQGVVEPKSLVTEYIISTGTYSRQTASMKLTLHQHECTANVDRDGEHVRFLKTACRVKQNIFFAFQFAVIAGGCTGYMCSFAGWIKMTTIS